MRFFAIFGGLSAIFRGLSGVLVSRSCGRAPAGSTRQPQPASHAIWADPTPTSENTKAHTNANQRQEHRRRPKKPSHFRTHTSRGAPEIAGHRFELATFKQKAGAQTARPIRQLRYKKIEIITKMNININWLGYLGLSYKQHAQRLSG